MRRVFSWSIAPCLAVVLAWGGIPGVGPDAKEARGDDDVVVTADAPRGGSPNAIFFDSQIDSMLDGIVAGDVAGQPTAFELRIAEVDAACGLDDAQRLRCTKIAEVQRAILAAGLGRLRRAYAGRGVDFTDAVGQMEWQRFHAEMQQLQVLAQPQAGQSDHLGRFVVGVLDDGQRERWEEEVRLRDTERYEAAIACGLECFVLRHGLTARQHAALAELVADSRPRLDVGRLERTLGSNNPLVFVYLLSRIAPERIATVLDERQRESLTAWIAEREGMIRHIEASVVRED